jgi:hypothetical protein
MGQKSDNWVVIEGSVEGRETTTIVNGSLGEIHEIPYLSES